MCGLQSDLWSAWLLRCDDRLPSSVRAFLSKPTTLKQQERKAAILKEKLTEAISKTSEVRQGEAEVPPVAQPMYRLLKASQESGRKLKSKP